MVAIFPNSGKCCQRLLQHKFQLNTNPFVLIQSPHTKMTDNFSVYVHNCNLVANMYAKIPVAAQAGPLIYSANNQKCHYAYANYAFNYTWLHKQHICISENRNWKHFLCKPLSSSFYIHENRVQNIISARKLVSFIFLHIHIWVHFIPFCIRISREISFHSFCIRIFHFCKQNLSNVKITRC